MDWKLTTALAVLGHALVGGLVICIVTSVNAYAKRIAEEPEDKRRGFEVKATTADDKKPSALPERDDHHG